MFFKRNHIEKKIQRLKQIWDDAVAGASEDIEKEAFSLAFEIINADNSIKDVKWKLAACYNFGIGCDENLVMAKNLFLEIVDDNEYSWIYKLLGNISFDNEEDDAVMFYSKYLNSHKEDMEAVVFLADCYINGIGVEKDTNKAVELYQSIIGTDYSNNVEFQRSYGLFLAEIESQDSVIWLKKAAEQGCSTSACELARQFAKANYFPFNSWSPTLRINRAIYYLKTAIELGKDENGFTEDGYIAINEYNILMAELDLPQREGE